MHMHSYIGDSNFDTYIDSELVRPFERPTQHRQPLSSGNAAALVRYWTLNGRCTDVSNLATVLTQQTILPLSNNSANLALLHPRLFNSLILIESAIYAGLDRRMALTQSKGMAKRKEIINAPETLKARIDTLPFYQTWDPRARSALLEHGYVDARTSQPVNLNTHVPKLPIRTSTPRDSEVSLIYRPNFNFVGKDGPDKASIYERLAVPDANLAATNIYPFYRPENIGVYQRLEYIRASVFYIGGDASASSTPEIRKHRLEHTGIGPGGSGGHRHDRVKEMVVHGGGHQIAMDVHLPEVTKGIGGWVAEEMQLWRDLTRVVQSQGDERAKADPTMVASFLEWTADGRPIEEIVKSKL